MSVEASPDLWTNWIPNGSARGATLIDKTAREEFGLTQDNIVRAIRAGTLHYREGSMYGKGILMLFAIICCFLAALDVKLLMQFTPLGLLFCALALCPS